jgi:glutathione S-transferase
MMTLYGRGSSCNVQKALWVIAELDLDCEHIELGGDFGGLDTPHYRRLNPNGRVPTLVDSATDSDDEPDVNQPDVVVWESEAIIRYLARRYGEGRLWPSEFEQQTRLDQWLAWAQTTLQPPWIQLFWQLVRTPPEQQQPAQIDALRRKAIGAFGVLEQQLAGREYLLGPFSLADIPAGMTLYRWFEMEIDRPAMPNLEAWYATLSSRPAYTASVRIPFDDLIGKLAY